MVKIIDSFSYPIRRQTTIKSTLQMVTSITRGSVVALVTPMTPNREIDYPKFVDLLKWHVAEGTNGAVVLGTTGEASMISMEERQKIIMTAVETVKGSNFPIIVGAGTINTNEVIKLSQQAESLGADGILAITPYYVKPPQRALVTHFNAIADSISIPVILYNCPGRTGVGMTVETVAQCSKNKNIIGLKDAVGDAVERIKPIKELCGDGFLLYSGEDDLGCRYVLEGGDGVISVTANCAPNSMQRMLKEAHNRNEQVATEINGQLVGLHSGLFAESNPIPVKKALYFMGKIDTGIRPPLCELEEKHYQRIIDALNLANVQLK